MNCASERSRSPYPAGLKCLTPPIAAKFADRCGGSD